MRWIPCSERLPEERGYVASKVLFYAGPGYGIGCGYLSEDVGRLWWFDALCTDQDGSPDSILLEQVTHWMPLPEPP